jgi:2,3-bisphosphoglycerate-independent phosphoglycerate mutase
MSDIGPATAMDLAEKPFMDKLAQKSVCGFVKTVPDGMVPESDTANLSIFGYDPRIYSKGRAPLEAASMGLEMRDGDTAMRFNLVTLSDGSDGSAEYADKIITDHSADEITTEEARELVKDINKFLGDNAKRFHTGVSYRHCVLWEDIPEYVDFVRPHDILDKRIGEYLPKGEFLSLMEQSYEILNTHKVNSERRRRGLRPANSIWFWSPGGKPGLPRFNMSGTVISAVDLIKGIGTCAGLKTPDIPGATGTLNTNYQGKAAAAISALRGGDEFVFVHIEAPDECSHRGEPENKIKAIELIDKHIVGPVYEYLQSAGFSYVLAVLPDHPTPISTRTHSSDPVPFLLYDSEKETISGIDSFNEKNIKLKSAVYLDKGHEFISRIMGK